MAGGRPDAADLVGGDAHADAAAADEDAAIDASFTDGLGHLEREVRIIDAGVPLRAHVADLVVELRQEGDDAPFDIETAMIASDGNSHGCWISGRSSSNWRWICWA